MCKVWVVIGTRDYEGSWIAGVRLTEAGAWKLYGKLRSENTDIDVEYSVEEHDASDE